MLKKLNITKKRIYMDYAGGAPELPTVTKAVAQASSMFFANPSSIHRAGVEARRVLEDARKSVAGAIGAHTDEIIFTSGGTESDNLAILGVVRHAQKLPQYADTQVHVITSMIEHPAVLEAMSMLESEGVRVTYLPVDASGQIDLALLRQALSPETVLVSIMYANNEIGTIAPIREIAKILRHYKKELTKTSNLETRTYPIFHTDACQIAPYIRIGVEQLGVDLLSLNGSKIGGPRGTGILFVRRNTPIDSILAGGGQEFGLRSGTENVPGAIGFSIALAHVQKNVEREHTRLLVLRDFFKDEIIKQFPDARLNGSFLERLPNNVHVSFKNIQSELLVLELDAKGIAVSAGSACASAKDTGSHVLTALYGKGDEKKWGSVRFSFGSATQKKDIVRVLVVLDAIMKKYSIFTGVI